MEAATFLINNKLLSYIIGGVYGRVEHSELMLYCCLKLVGKILDRSKSYGTFNKPSINFRGSNEDCIATLKHCF